MKRILTLAAAAAACAVTMAGPASAFSRPEPLLHECRGHLDYACTDCVGNFCTLYTGARCTIGLPL